MKFLWYRPTYLPTDGIACNSCKACIPQPAQNISSGFDTRMFGPRVISVLPFLNICHYGIPFLREADAYEEDIALLKGNVAFYGNRKDIRQADLVVRERGVLDALLFRPCGIINQHATS